MPKPNAFDALQEKLAPLRQEYEAKVNAIEEEWLISCGIKKEDLYSPEERAQRFSDLLTACINTKPLPMKYLKLKNKVKRNVKRLEKAVMTDTDPGMEVDISVESIDDDDYRIIVRTPGKPDIVSKSFASLDDAMLMLGVLCDKADDLGGQRIYQSGPMPDLSRPQKKH